ncbi:MAG: isochorismatase family protein [Deltaproteobacteria bacterium]|nr:isochorismatase family protein [Deltaproteobacteria bacterium]
MAQDLVTLAEKVDPAHAGLIVIDMQNDYCCSEGAIGKTGADLSPVQAMVPRLVGFIEQARSVSVPVFFVVHHHGRWTDTPAWLQRQSRFGVLPPEQARRTAVEGTWGAELVPEMKPTAEDRVVVKHRYSAFINTELETVLRARGIRTLLMTGTATNVCVESTLRHGFMLDYHIVLVEDCAACTDETMHRGTLENVRRHFGLVAKADEIMGCWQAARPVSPAPAR